MEMKQMIMEKSTRLKINRIISFNFKADPKKDIEGQPYGGDSGKVFDIRMPFGDRNIRLLLFDSEFGRKHLLNGRFCYGKQARQIYRHCCATTAKALECYFPDVLGYVEHAKEHQILRAGRILSLAPFIEGLKTQGDDFKRNPTIGDDLYKARSTGNINWGTETTHIFSDICPASGSTMEAFVEKAVKETTLKKIIFNCSTGTINALNRVIPKIPANIEVDVIYWEALFSVWREDITLPDGETIYAGTVINLNPDPDFPENDPIAPAEVVDYIHKIFQRDKVRLLPDIPGEVGEKVQDHWLGPITYDILEFYTAGIDFSQSPWKEKMQYAWNLPGVRQNFKMKLPYIYSDIESRISGDNEEIGTGSRDTEEIREFALL
jgi:hypothetical protein